MKTHSITAIVICILFAGFPFCLETIKGADQPEEKIMQERLDSMDRLKQIGAAITLYSENNKTFPKNIEELKPYLNSNLSWALENVSYRKIDAASQPATPVAFDKTIFSKGYGTVVLYNDGHVEFVNLAKLTKLGIPRIFMEEESAPSKSIGPDGQVSNPPAFTQPQYDNRFHGANPAVYRPQTQCVLSGHITDAKTGQPVTDATVIADHSFRAKTDANGYYRIDTVYNSRNCRVAVDSNEYVGILSYDAMPVVNLSSDTPTVKDFKLDKGCMVQLRVIDEANQPIDGAELMVASITDEYSNKFRDIRRRTDKNGMSLLGGLPTSKMAYLITAIHGNYIKTPRAKDGAIISQIQWDYAPGKLEVILNDPNVIETGTIVLQKGVDVKGNAQYEDCVPASDIKIYAYPEWWLSSNMPESFPLDANGDFTLRHVAAGNYRIMANMPESQDRTISILILRTVLPLADNGLLKLTIPQKSPQSLVSIRGKLVFTGDKIPNRVNIDVYSSNNRERISHSYYWPNYQSDPCDTSFVIDRLEPGKYRVTAISSEIERKVIEDVNAPCEGLEIKLEPAEKPILKGTVIDSRTNEPVRSFKARAKRTKILREVYNSQPDKWIDFNDVEGKFDINAAGSGIYQIQIAAEGYAWTWSEDVNTDQNLPIVIKLKAGGSIKGSVVDEKGNAVDGAKVLPLSKALGVSNTLPSYMKDPFESEDGTVETVNGKFELKNLAAGKESIKVLHPDYAYSIINDIEVNEGRTTEGIKVVLNKGATVQGYVYDDEGQPQSNVTLNFREVLSSSEKSGGIAEVTTDVNGYYKVECLPEKIMVLKRQREQDYMGVVCRTIVPATGKVSQLDLGGQPNVTGRLIIDGKQIAGRRLLLSGLRGVNSDGFRCYTMTENDGAFTFGGIPKGKWVIYFDDTDNRNRQMKCADFELTDQTLNLGTIPKGISTVSVSIEYDPKSPKWNITRAYLQDDNNFWSPSATEITIPNDANQPYIAKNVLPGEHYLVLARKDYSSLKFPLKVSENNQNINIRLPNYSAGIHGRITSKYPSSQTVWTKDKSVVSNIRPDTSGNYKLENLPAGQYLLGGNMLLNNTAILEFELKEGEQKALDINIPEIPPNQKGSLQVVVLDENGTILTGAKVWLESSTGRVEPIDNIGLFYFVTEPQDYTLHAKFAGYKEFKKQVLIENYGLIRTTNRLPEPLFVRLEKQ